MAALPNFFIGGVSSAGTSFLATVLKQHPDIYIPDNIVPEPHFFLKSWEYERGIEYYLQRWFTDVRKETAIGEKSSSYLFGGVVVAKRIKDILPHAKFIFSLRNPIERTWASYRFTVLNGLEPLDFENALKQEAKRVAEQTGHWAEVQPYNYTGRGLYASQIKEYLEYFSREDIHIIKFEEMVSNPIPCLREIFRFLGVDESFKPKLPDGKFTSLEIRDPVLQRNLREKFGDRFSLIIKAVRQGGDPKIYIKSPEENEYLSQLYGNLVDGKCSISSETRSYLQNLFHKDMQQLREIVDFSIEDWC